MRECDRLGRSQFLAKYGFSEAKSYFVQSRGRLYDSKAIVGVAHKYEFPREGPLRASDFSGGEATVQRKLEAPGFRVLVVSDRASEFDDRSFGEIPGVPPNTSFPSRKALSAAGVHKPLMAGISGAGDTGADSIVLSGGY